jgi:hypothetical protein
MGAYMISYPRAKILTLIPIFIIPYFIEIPAFFFLGIWFLLQFLNAAGSSSQVGGVAWWAHIGGFISGILLLKFLLKVPETGINDILRDFTPKRNTPRLQVIRIIGSRENSHLNGEIIITPREARLGTKKTVNIPWGFHGRLFRITIPPGVIHGTTLRLKGMGREMFNGQMGDMYLKVLIKDKGEPMH